jgi:multiple sugar transport system permease protein
MPHKRLQTIAYALLSLAAIVMLFPLLWMTSTAFKQPNEIYSLRLIPSSFSFNNVSAVFEKTLFHIWLSNSAVIAAFTTLSVAVFDTLAGYILSKFDFRGKTLIFVLIVSTLMIPTEMLIIPWYMLSAKLNWVDTNAGVLFPGVVSAFGIFLMRQFAASVPDELLDAARIDGMGEWRIVLTVVAPLMKSAVFTLAILTFLGSWNAFIWPLIVLQSPEHLTVPVGLAFFSSESKDSASWSMMMTGAAISVIPMIAVFLVFQKQIIRGIALTGLK